MNRVLIFLFLFFPLFAQATISRHTYHTVLNVTENIYGKIFAQQKKHLQISRNWENDELRASAWHQEDRRGIIAELRIPGGIARHPLVNADAFTLIVCHEIGHHLAGEPKIWRYSVEGQADYFGASECLRRILPKLPENYTLRHRMVPNIVTERCQQNYITEQERTICIRTIMAGYRLAKFLAKKEALKEPHLNQAEQHIVKQTNYRVPSPQCRLDTYIAAALCQVERQDKQNWLCVKGKHSLEMIRPACWFSSKVPYESESIGKK